MVVDLFGIGVGFFVLRLAYTIILIWEKLQKWESRELADWLSEYQFACLPTRYGENYRERAALICLALHLYPSAVSLYQILDDC